MSRTVTNSGTSTITLETGDNPVTIDAGVTIATGSPNALTGLGAIGYGWVVDNQGTLQAAIGDGVAFATLGTLTNATGASISGYTFGVNAADGGTVVNMGRIVATRTAGATYTGSIASGVTPIAAAVVLAGGMITNAGGTIAGGSNGVWLAGDGISTATVSNAGTIDGTKAFGILLTQGGVVTNAAAGSVYGGLYGVFSESAFSVTNQASGVIGGAGNAIDGQGGGGTITNLGAILGGGYGINLLQVAGTVSNQGTIIGTKEVGVGLRAGGTVGNLAGGTITGSFAGVFMGGAGSIANQGMIQSGSKYSVYAAVYDGQTIAYGGVVMRGGGAVTNLGGSVVNSGGSAATIAAGTITGASYGLYIANGLGQVTNGGSIASAGSYRGAGVALVAGGTLNNQGGAQISGSWIGVQEGLFPRYTSLSPATKAARQEAAAPATILNSGTIDASNGVNAGAALWLAGPTTVTNAAGGVIQGAKLGTPAGGPFGIVAYYATTVINRGFIGGTDSSLDAANATLATGNLVEMAPGASFGATVMGAHSASLASMGTLELLSGASAGTVSGVGSKYLNFGSIDMDLNAQWVVSGSMAGLAGGVVLSGFAVGDMLRITGVAGESVAGFNNGTLSLQGTAPLSVVFAGPSGTDFVVHDDPSVTTATDIALACFREGTRILTVNGERPVEALRVGDTVATLTGGLARVVWLGRRTINAARHPHPRKVWPVRVMNGAFGPQEPLRDLYLSADHAVFVDGVLIPVRYLVNGDTVAFEPCARITYWHVELARHAAILADGLACESYLDTGNRGAFEGEPALDLHADFALRIWHGRACAPLVLGGADVVRVRQRLAGRTQNTGGTSSASQKP